MWSLKPCCQDPLEEMNFSGHHIFSHTLLSLPKGQLTYYYKESAQYSHLAFNLCMEIKYRL